MKRPITKEGRVFEKESTSISPDLLLQSPSLHVRESHGQDLALPIRSAGGTVTPSSQLLLSFPEVVAVVESDRLAAVLMMDFLR